VLGRPLEGRRSLRTNAFLMVLAVLFLPHGLVVAWSAMERDIGGRLQWSARETAADAADVLRISWEDGASEALVEARLAEIASRHTARIRLIGEGGRSTLDLDRDQGTDLVHQVGTLFFGPDGAPTLREFDETLGPVASRVEIGRVAAWTPDAAEPARPLRPGAAPPVESGCRTSPAGKLLVCHAARPIVGRSGEVEVIYVQESSRRAVRALYDLRYHLLRLSLFLLPLALLFSWWMGRRMVFPIEWLRDRVLEKARSGDRRPDLVPPPGHEVADLAQAFNDLLGTLDERQRENEAFVADLVHEFKNPVAAIRTCAETLGSGGPGGVDERKAARIARILADSSSRLDGLVSQFLELARAEAGMPNEARGEVDLTALARGIATALEPGHPDVAFVVEAEGPLPVTGVGPRLDSLVRNLLDNAASFAETGEGEARVVVRVRAETSAQRLAAGRSVVLEVTDTGPGIPEKDLPRMFERFFTTRAMAGATSPEPSSASRRLRGTGLGLALVKAVAEAHGGSVAVVSEPGRGATFRVVLPASPR